MIKSPHPRNAKRVGNMVWFDVALTLPLGLALDTPPCCIGKVSVTEGLRFPQRRSPGAGTRKPLESVRLQKAAVLSTTTHAFWPRTSGTCWSQMQAPMLGQSLRTQKSRKCGYSLGTGLA